MKTLWLLGLLAMDWSLVAERQVRAPSAEMDTATALQRVALARDLARAAPSGALSARFDARAQALGLLLRRDGDTVTLMEPAPPWQGLGVMVLRLGPLPTELVLQAPHPTSDLDTGAIVAQLYADGGVRAAVFATTHRNAEDAAHAADGPLQQLTQGLAEGLPNPLIVQLHGFGEDTTDADVVVALGQGLGDEACFAQLIGTSLLAAEVRTGAEEPELAARKNAQSALLRGVARFVHVELSRTLRASLLAEPTRRALLMETLQDLAAGRHCGASR